MAAAGTRQIVLVRLVEDFRLANPNQIARVDLGERAKLESYLRPEALMWLRAGTPGDVANAQAWAKREGYDVKTYLTTERDPLGRAKKEAEIAQDCPLTQRFASRTIPSWQPQRRRPAAPTRLPAAGAVRPRD